jgi:hypothetical protein
VAFPLVFLFVGLAAIAWTITLESDWTEAGIFGVQPSKMSQAISGELDQTRGREIVMVSLVETEEEQ